MATNLLFSLLRDKWLILPQYAHDKQAFVNALLNGKAALATESKEQRQLTTHYTTSTNSNGRSNGTQKTVAIIDIRGAITKYDTWCNYGAMSYAAAIAEANNDKHVAAIVLNIDSPGGAATGGAMLADAVRNSQKPVVAYVGYGYAASAAYWAASQASEIVMDHDSDSVGSIGAYTTLINPDGAYEKEGYKIQTIYAPQSTDKNANYRKVFDPNEPSTKGIEHELEDLVNLFIAEVKAGRGNRIVSDEVFTGKMYNTKEAIALGLADHKGTLAFAVQRALEIAHNQNSNKNMTHQLSIPKTQAVLGWKEFETMEDGGIYLQATEAEAIEAHLNGMEEQLAAITEERDNLSSANATLTEQLAAVTEERNNLSAANETLTTQLNEANERIAALEAQLQEWGAKPSTNGTQQPVTEDPKPVSKASVADDPLTAEAKRLYAMYNA